MGKGRARHASMAIGVTQLSARVARSRSRAFDGRPNVTVMKSIAQRVIVLSLAALATACAKTQPQIHSATAPIPTPVPVPEVITLSGQITYPEKVAMAASVVVRIQVVDVSRADAPAEAIASTEVLPEGRQIPIDYSIQVPRKAFEPNHRYQVMVRITEGPVLRFITKVAHPVDPGMTGPLNIMVNAVPQRLW